MAKSEEPLPPQEVCDAFIDRLAEQDITASIAYEQLRLQHAAGSIGRSVIGAYMKSIFRVDGVPEDVPEEFEQGTL